MLHGVHLIHPSISSSSNERKGLKKSWSCLSRRNNFSPTTFFRAYIKQLKKKKKTMRDKVVLC